MCKKVYIIQNARLDALAILNLLALLPSNSTIPSSDQRWDRNQSPMLMAAAAVDSFLLKVC
jgi:hypothetical protein